MVQKRFKKRVWSEDGDTFAADAVKEEAAEPQLEIHNESHGRIIIKEEKRKKKRKVKDEKSKDEKKKKKVKKETLKEEQVEEGQVKDEVDHVKNEQLQEDYLKQEPVKEEDLVVKEEVAPAAEPVIDLTALPEPAVHMHSKATQRKSKGPGAAETHETKGDDEEDDVIIVDHKQAAAKVPRDRKVKQSSDKHLKKYQTDLMPQKASQTLDLTQASCKHEDQGATREAASGREPALLEHMQRMEVQMQEMQQEIQILRQAQSQRQDEAPKSGNGASCSRTAAAEAAPQKDGLHGTTCLGARASNSSRLEAEMDAGPSTPRLMPADSIPQAGSDPMGLQTPPATQAPQPAAAAGGMDPINREQMIICHEVKHLLRRPVPMRADLRVEGGTGSGKTHLLQSLAILASIENKRCLCTAPSSKGRLRFKGGMTAAKAFGLGEGHGAAAAADRGSCIRGVDILITDDAHMLHREHLERMDLVLRQTGFSGVWVIATNSQALPAVVPRSDQYHAAGCLRAFQTLHLTEQMRITDAHLARAVRDIGRGSWPAAPMPGSWDRRPGYGVPVDLSTLCRSVSMQGAMDFLTWGSAQPDGRAAARGAFRHAGIICSTNDHVDVWNNRLLDATPGRMITLQRRRRANTEIPNVCVTPAYKFYPISSRDVGMPLRVKPGAPVVVTCDVRPEAGLCTNALARVVTAGADSVTIELQRPHAGHRAVWTLGRVGTQNGKKQVPLRLAFAMTANRAASFQMDRAVVDLSERCFAHGQLGTAISRVRRREDLRLYSDVGGTVACNVVSKNLLVTA